MKYLIIGLLAIMANIRSGFGSPSANLKNPDTLKLIIKQYPASHTMVYILDSNNVEVRLSETNFPDSVVFKGKSDTAAFRRCVGLIQKLTKERYEQKCIEDGMVISIAFIHRDSTLKKVIFSNYFNPNLYRIINIINERVDILHRIVYRKSDLNKNCK